jgi:hypothetical protein
MKARVMSKPECNATRRRATRRLAVPRCAPPLDASRRNATSITTTTAETDRMLRQWRAAHDARWTVAAQDCPPEWRPLHTEELDQRREQIEHYAAQGSHWEPPQ